MKLDRAIKIQNEAINTLRSTYRTARVMGYNQTWIHQEETRIFGRLPKNFPIMRHNYLSIACRVLWEEMFDRDIESVYLYNNETYSTHKKTKHHKCTSGVDAKTLHYNNSGFAFFWIKTGKMYSPDWSKV